MIASVEMNFSEALILIFLAGAMVIYLRNRYAYATASVERVFLLYLTRSVWLFVVRAIIFHKKYYSYLVYIAKPLLRDTG